MRGRAINSVKKQTETMNKQKLKELVRKSLMNETDIEENKVFIYNEIRGLKDVVVVTVEKSDYLDSQATVDAEFSLLKIKYIVRSTPEEDIKKIATDAKISSKIPGLLQFIPRLQTIRKVGEY